jgi:hypothetical protein
MGTIVASKEKYANVRGDKTADNVYLFKMELVNNNINESSKTINATLNFYLKGISSWRFSNYSYSKAYLKLSSNNNESISGTNMNSKKTVGYDDYTLLDSVTKDFTYKSDGTLTLTGEGMWGYGTSDTGVAPVDTYFTGSDVQWAADQLFSVTFNLSKGTFTSTYGSGQTYTKTVIKGNSLTTPLLSATQSTNANSIQWYDSTNSKTYTAGSSITPTSDLTLGSNLNYKLTLNYNTGGESSLSNVALYNNGVVSTTSGYGTLVSEWATYPTTSALITLPKETTTVPASGTYLYRSSTATKKLKGFGTTSTSSSISSPGATINLSANSTRYAIWQANNATYKFIGEPYDKLVSIIWKYSDEDAWVTVNRGTATSITINPLLNTSIDYYFIVSNGYETTYDSEENYDTLEVTSSSIISSTVLIAGKPVTLKLQSLCQSSIVNLGEISSQVGAIVDLTEYSKPNVISSVISNDITINFDLSKGGDSAAKFTSTGTQQRSQSYAQYQKKEFSWSYWQDQANNKYYSMTVTVTPEMLANNTLTARYNEASYVTYYTSGNIILSTIANDITSSFNLSGWFNEDFTKKIAESTELYILPNSSEQYTTYTLYGNFLTSAEPGIYIYSNSNWTKIFNVDENNFLKLI